MTKGVQYRATGGGVIIPTPLYVDDRLLSEIVLGERMGQWRDIGASLEIDGLPQPRASVGGLYYLPAIIRFLDRREGLAPSILDFPDDGPVRFDR
jgi:hypothetical protein